MYTIRYTVCSVHDTDWCSEMTEPNELTALRNLVMVRDVTDLQAKHTCLPRPHPQKV